MSSPPSSRAASATRRWQKASLADVAGQRHRLASGLPDERHHLGRIRLLGRQVVDGHVRALAGIGDGRGAADARIAAGDQRLAAGEPSGALVARLAVVRARHHPARQPRPRLLLLLEGGLRIAARRVRSGVGLRDLLLGARRTSQDGHHAGGEATDEGAPRGIGLGLCHQDFRCSSRRRAGRSPPPGRPAARPPVIGGGPGSAIGGEVPTGSGWRRSPARSPCRHRPRPAGRRSCRG